MNDKNLIDSSFDVLIKVGNKRRLFANDNTDTNPFRDVKFLNKIHDFNQYYKEFYAHSSILLKNTKSKYFYNAIIPERKHDTLNNTFTVNSNEKLSTIHPCDEKKRKDNVKVIILELPNIEPSIFEVILEGNLDVVDFTKQKMISILFASSFLNLKPLITHLFTNNFFGTLHSLNASYFSSNLNDNELDQRKCIVDQLCLEYTSNLFISDVYLSFHKGFIYDILSSNNLIMNELEVWTKLIKWGIHNSNLSPKNSSLASNALPNEMIKGFSNKQLAALEGMIKDFISLIRFHHIGLDDYFKEIGKPFKNILPKGLNKAIFKYHMKKEIFKNMIILSARYYQQIDSTIIVGEQTALLAKWIKECKSSNVDHNFLTLEELVKEEKQFKFKLLLRGSKHGFGIGTFHKICDGIDNTICIIKVKNSGEIIGGYNPFSWQSYYRFGFQTYPYRGYNVPCSSSFLFSLNNNNIRHDNHSTKNILSKVKKNHISEAIYYSQINGPKFGRHDLYLMNKSMSYNRSIHDNKEKLVGYCKQYSYTQQIIDKPFLEIEDYEIFQVIIDV
ncbi:10404_t:CDS:2 [Funneliformis caledonium]|uniref:10404_t:CDS:1 n=1 Tax=Funneliformis caledonium TaxID=1117310 RepID=A0A9N8V830_9GLOM|nr:10404_t:CDS:2 [Funneliformis caledonium]